jgi:hypothetical protein
VGNRAHDVDHTMHAWLSLCWHDWLLWLVVYRIYTDADHHLHGLVTCLYGLQNGLAVGLVVTHADIVEDLVIPNTWQDALIHAFGATLL